ncbi:MAG: hypothetical protein HYX47_06735 [Burkholderiales bacterium]|nr:hypothetical protein [Burkholderiales bacterium]
MHANPLNVGQIDSFITMLRAACEDRAMRSRLEHVLSLPPHERLASLHGWVSDLIIARAPQELVKAIACLLDGATADKALEVLRNSHPSGHVQPAGDEARLAWAVVLTCAFAAGCAATLFLF